LFLKKVTLVTIAIKRKKVEEFQEASAVEKTQEA